MTVRLITKTMQNFYTGLKEVAAHAKPNFHNKVWKGLEMGNKLAQRNVSINYISGIKTLAASGVGLVMASSINTPSKEHNTQKLTEYMMVLALDGPLHPMFETPKEVSNAIRKYLESQLNIVMCDPSSFVNGCVIQVSSVEVLPFLNDKKLSNEIPAAFLVFVSANTLQAVMQGETYQMNVTIAEDGIKIPSMDALYALPGHSNNRE